MKRKDQQYKRKNLSGASDRAGAASRALLLFLEAKQQEKRKQIDQIKTKRTRRKSNPLTLFAAVCICLILIIQVGHSALLTNIYGKKLSEITELEHRFLLLPLSPNHHELDQQQHRQKQQQQPQLESDEQKDQALSPTSVHSGGLYIKEEEEEEEEAAAREQKHQDEKQDVKRGINKDNSEISTSRNARSLVLERVQLTRNGTTIATSGQESLSRQMHPEASPLAASWKQQQQQQSVTGRQMISSDRLTMAAAAAAPQNSNSYSSSSSSYDTNRSPGGGSEPILIESLTTEFPNPNINNLGHEITKILRKFFQHGYDKRVRPNYSGPPALVNVSFHIIGISSVDEVQMDFTTDFYFRQKWFDPRLEFDAVGEIDELCVGAEFAERIWLPDTFFANEKTATFHKATTENTFIRIGQNGRVYRSIRLTVTCSCPMDLQYFPMDRQRCKIEIESYGYNTRDIDYRWERGDASVTLNTKIELPQFKILGFKMGQEIQNLSSGDYIRLYCEIHFVRSMGYYLFQIYIPASLIVMISWVSFWLHRNATPARVALGVTTVLTMTTLMSSTNAALPKISYIKSIDVFLGTCFVMVFAALLEYASVGYIGKRIAMKRKRLQDLQQMQQLHQKVCVAAKASAVAAEAAAAAAAAAAASQTPTSSSSNNNKKTAAANATEPAGALPPSQTLHRRSMGGLMRIMNETLGGSKTLQRASLASSPSSLTNQNQNRGINDHSGDLGAQFGDRPTSRTIPRSQNLMNSFLLGNATNPTDNSRVPLLAAGAAIAAAANQHSHGPTTEFEVNQTHDMIRIYGLTPSAIDKHSRVVFPICFVCFNLMYWIIYGHISQQIEDKGPPLIPFIKN